MLSVGSDSHCAALLLAPMDTAIPVTVVTGFLGAGKSTLLERWLGELPRAGTVVIINEQGQVGIDGELLAERAARLREITGGCVCCRAQAELDATLAEFASASPRPTRILVETSGAASPAGVIRALTLGSARDRLRLDGVVTVLDASRAEAALAFDLTVEQLGFADVVVLSHADACDPASVQALEADLGRYAPGAVFARGHRGAVAGDEGLLGILAKRGEVLRPLPSETTTHSHIDAVALVLDDALDEERFGDWVESSLGAVQARILRVKGILAVQGVDARVIVQGVGDAIEVSLGPAWGEAQRHSRMVVLGLELDADALRAGLLGCVAPRPSTV